MTWLALISCRGCPRAPFVHGVDGSLAGRAVTVIIEDSQLRILHDGNPLAAHLFTPGGLRHVRES
jgi:hypothetical protein